MDKTKCCPAPEEACEEREKIVQPAGNTHKHTAENKKQSPVQHGCFKLCCICVMMVMAF